MDNDKKMNKDKNFLLPIEKVFDIAYSCANEGYGFFDGPADVARYLVREHNIDPDYMLSNYGRLVARYCFDNDKTVIDEVKGHIIDKSEINYNEFNEELIKKEKIIKEQEKKNLMIGEAKDRYNNLRFLKKASSILKGQKPKEEFFDNLSINEIEELYTERKRGR